MSPLVQLRRGKGPFWGPLKKSARALLSLHLPVIGLTRPLFALLYVLHVGARSGILGFLRFFWFEPLFRSQCVSVGSGFRMEKLPFIEGRGRIQFGHRVCLAGKSSISFGNRWKNQPELVIGDDSFVGGNCSFAVADTIRIGEHCLMAGRVSTSDYDGHPLDPILSRSEPAPPEAIRPVEIGDDVWIGADAKILKGVSIGDRSIIAAGAIVTRPVPADVLVVGNPAWVVRTLPGTCS